MRACTHAHTHTQTGMNTYCTYMQIKISRRCILQCFQCTVAMQDYCKIEMQSALTVKKSYKQVIYVRFSLAGTDYAN